MTRTLDTCARGGPLCRLAIMLALATAVAAVPHEAVAQKIKVGYWSSGVSIGFFAVLQSGKFLEKQGLEPEYVPFADVTGPAKALITHSVDVTFGAPMTTSLTLGAQGAPVEILMASQIAEAAFVAKPDSPIKSIADFKGKKIGMSPVGSAVYAITAAVLERNHGIKPTDFTPIGGNEGRLLQFVEQGDVAAAALRTVTLASVPDLKLNVLGNLVDEWKTLTKGTAPPILGTALVHTDFSKSNPDAAVKYVKGLMEATQFGRTHPDEATAMLKQASNLDAKDATSYVRLWDKIYIASMEPADIATMKAMADIFRASKTLEGDVPEAI